MHSTPLRLHVCNHNGACVAVKTDFVIMLHGTVAEVPLHRVMALQDALYEASDTLDDDDGE